MNPLPCIARHARSFLFVPASRPDRFVKALASEADAVVIDLEDAVGDSAKDDAREALAQYLPKLSSRALTRVVVRVNGAGTPWHDSDLALLRKYSGRGIAAMLPKSEHPSILKAVISTLGDCTPIIALVESLTGLDAAEALAQTPRVLRLAFGHLDFQLDLGMRATADEPELAFARNVLVAASRRAGLPAPIDGVTTDTGNVELLKADTQRSRAFGFSGKLCIHPSQVSVVNDAMGDTKAERAWAQRVLKEAACRGGEAFSLDGRMVDLPVIRMAEAIVARTRG